MIGFCTSMCSFLVANINGVILKVSTAFTSASLQENSSSLEHVTAEFVFVSCVSVKSQLQRPLVTTTRKCRLSQSLIFKK